MKFTDLTLHPDLLRGVQDMGYETLTPIQERAIPLLLEGHDLLGCAQTGTGKTAGFALPILQNLLDADHADRKIRALVVAPTRELAIQVEENFAAYAKHTHLRSTVIFGGVKQGKQVQRLQQKGVDVLVATPGRLLDLIGQGLLTLKHIEYFVLDEADHMLDMGFIHDIRRLLKQLPDRRQSLFFSATMPSEIKKLADSILHRPKRVTIAPEQTTAERVDQIVYPVNKPDKRKLLLHLLRDEEMESTLVFTRTKHGADRVARQLDRQNVPAAAIHGNKSQGQRQRALQRFKDGDLRVLVATDIAARGIDVSELSHVINYDLPNVSETYVHRIGRTGRAAASGVAISFCDVEERPYLRDIEKLIQQNLSRIDEHPFHPSMSEEEREAAFADVKQKPKPNPSRSKPQKKRNGGGNNNGGARNQGGDNSSEGSSRSGRRRRGRRGGKRR